MKNGKPYQPTKDELNFAGIQEGLLNRPQNRTNFRNLGEQEAYRQANAPFAVKPIMSTNASNARARRSAQGFITAMQAAQNGDTAPLKQWYQREIKFRQTINPTAFARDITMMQKNLDRLG